MTGTRLRKKKKNIYKFRIKSQPVSILHQDEITKNPRSNSVQLNFAKVQIRSFFTIPRQKKLGKKRVISIQNLIFHRHRRSISSKLKFLLYIIYPTQRAILHCKPSRAFTALPSSQQQKTIVYSARSKSPGRSTSSPLTKKKRKKKKLPRSSNISVYCARTTQALAPCGSFFSVISGARTGDQFSLSLSLSLSLSRPIIYRKPRFRRLRPAPRARLFRQLYTLS